MLDVFIQTAVHLQGPGYPVRAKGFDNCTFVISNLYFPLFFYICLHVSNLADTLIQSNLQEQLGLSALLKGTDRFFT
jgi:hypothetical protein